MVHSNSNCKNKKAARNMEDYKKHTIMDVNIKIEYRDTCSLPVRSPI